VDRIFLRELKTEAIIGIFDWERKVKQTVSLDLELPADIRRAAKTDRIEDTLNYKAVAKRVLAFVEASEYQLVETLAEEIARMVLAGIAFAMDAPFLAYLAIWYVTDLGGDLYLWWLTWRELKRRGMTDAMRPKLKPHPLKGAWRFAIRVNLTSSLTAAWGPIARLLVGGLLGPASAAIYMVAATLADSAQKPSDLLTRAFYPEVMRMDVATKRPWKLMLRGSALAAMFGLAALVVGVVAGQPIIRLVFGEEVASAYPVLIVLMLAPFLIMISFPLPPMLYAVDRDDAPLTARIVGTIIYFAIVAPLSWQYGVTGAALAFVIGTAAMVAILVMEVAREYSKVRSR